MELTTFYRNYSLIRNKRKAEKHIYGTLFLDTGQQAVKGCDPQEKQTGKKNKQNESYNCQSLLMRGNSQAVS